MTYQASEVARFLNLPLVGPDVAITGPRSLRSIAPGGLVFAKSLTADTVAALNSCPGTLALVPAEGAGSLVHSHIVVDRPRLAFARAVTKFFASREFMGISPTAVVDQTAMLGEEVSIGPYTVIGPDVHIGAGTVIRSHVMIAKGTRVGRNCLVKSHAVIGEEGFGFERDEAGAPIRLPHLGLVEIGDDVEIGAGTIIARGTMDPTRIGHRVKLDDQVFVAHNVSIGDDTLVTACAEVSGSAAIGRRCWIGPNATVINGISIGDDSFIGIGAVVTKNVDANVTVAGNPAHLLRRN